MKKGNSAEGIAKGLLLAISVGLIFAATPSRADDCRERLLPDAYTCPFTFQVVTTTNGSDRVVVDNVQLTGVIAFSDFTNDSNPGHAFVGTFTIGTDSRTTYCSCKSQGGSSVHPRLGQSPTDFFCTTGGANDAGLLFEGKVTGSGKSINQGELWFEDPFFIPTPGNGQFRRGVFSCQRN